MEKIEKTTSEICIDSDYFCAKSTLTCGQVFRYFPAGEGYHLISGDKKCFLSTEGSRTKITTDHSDYFSHYFDLRTDYKKIVETLGSFAELAPALVKGRGIHILKQQLFETVISFIISANNNIPRIQGIIERLCEAYGDRMDGYYAFPTAEGLRDVRAEDYKRLGTGYRADYLQSTVHKILTSDILERLQDMDYEGAQRLLKTLMGVGQKVADCICLFGLGLFDCYPTDTWIKKAEGLSSAAKARQKGMDRYGSLAGYAQQYRFYHQISADKNS